MKKSDVLRALIKNLSGHVDSPDDSRLRIFISKELDVPPGDRKILLSFCKYAVAQLELKGSYKCYISSDRRRSRIKTTGICMFDKNEIRVYGRQRSLADILRSIAHEMFHLRQHESGVIPKKIKNKHFAEPLEWHANAAAGSLLSKFALNVGRDKVYR